MTTSTNDLIAISFDSIDGRNWVCENYPEWAAEWIPSMLSEFKGGK